MDKIQVAFRVLGTLGFIIAVIGCLIKFKNMIWLVGGVYKNEDKIKDKKGFASFVGGNVLILGLIFCAGALGMRTFPSLYEVIEPALLLSLLIIGIITIKKAKKYMV